MSQLYLKDDAFVVSYSNLFLHDAERLNLRPAEEYHYLNQSDCLTINEVNDAERFRVTRGAFSAVHISPEDQENAFAMLAAVLWLGNITFSIIDNENHVRVDYNEGKGLKQLL
eukprot:Gb_31403 [translate_table: standard]